MAGRRSLSKLLAAAVAATALFALASTAGAAIPKKDYACYGESNVYISTLEVKTSRKYKYLGDDGRYRADGKVMHFKSGPLEKWVGRAFKSDGDPAVKLVTDQAGGQTVNCYS